MTDFGGLIRRLVEHHVEFILIGGVAATIHGSARFTQDVDIVYGRTAENLRRLVAALADSSPYLRGAPPGLPFRWDSETLERGLNFTLTCTLGQIDLLGEITGGGGYTELLPASVTARAWDVEFRVLDLPALIRVKRAAGRPKDLESIAELEALYAERKRPRH
ncbi:MAG TPA: hypothetical protein VHY91_25435 [Pirellulales bacterium]|jgi:predicted nucleotidyltransferase|nr:hypothetical protein [Pirellulales bacterium]